MCILHHYHYHVILTTDVLAVYPLNTSRPCYDCCHYAPGNYWPVLSGPRSPVAAQWWWCYPVSQPVLPPPALLQWRTFLRQETGKKYPKKILPMNASGSICQLFHHLNYWTPIGILLTPFEEDQLVFWYVLLDWKLFISAISKCKNMSLLIRWDLIEVGCILYDVSACRVFWCGISIWECHHQAT